MAATGTSPRVVPLTGGHIYPIWTSDALQLVAYSATAAWIGGIFHLIPFLGSLLSLAAGVYTLYLFYLGAPTLRKCTTDKAVVFTIVYVLCAIVVGVLLSWVLLGVTGAGLSPMALSR